MAGEGAIQKWSVKKRRGKTTITGGSGPNKIEFQFVFGQGQQVMDGALELTSEETGTRVDWILRGRPSDNPSIKITAKMMQPYMAKDLRGGLERLQRISANWDAQSETTSEETNPSTTEA